MGEKNFFNTLKTLDTYLISPDFDLFFSSSSLVRF